MADGLHIVLHPLSHSLSSLTNSVKCSYYIHEKDFIDFRGVDQCVIKYSTDLNQVFPIG
jgi:hypothetical protein